MERAAYHRQQAEILTRLSKTISNVDSVSALLKLAAEHRALADAHERSIQHQQQIQPKSPTRNRPLNVACILRSMAGIGFRPVLIGPIFINADHDVIVVAQRDAAGLRGHARRQGAAELIEGRAGT
jgi:hypothetical protein